MSPLKHIVMFSGGAGSWCAAKRVAKQVDPQNVTLLFADTKMEDQDLYRFLHEAAKNVGSPLVSVADGRDPWDIFHDERFLGNTRVDPCSKILKRQLLRSWLEENHAPENTVVYLGFDWTEEHRVKRGQEYWKPWNVEAPLCRPPFLSKREMLEALQKEGIEPPRLYRMGFPHNNCGGFCIKAGQAHFRLLLKMMPERYAFHERKEEELRDYLGKDVAILRDRRGGKTRPMTLSAFRKRVESGEQTDLFEWGGCGCFSE